MTFVTPTVMNILARAIAAARQRPQLLLLLTLLCGIISSILYRPAAEVIDTVLMALQNGETISEERVNAAAQALADGGTTLLLGHLMVTATASFLLIPWARAVAPGGLVPATGGLPAFLRRGLRSFLHMVAANGVSILLFLFFLPLASLLAGLAGGLGSLVMMAAMMVLVWLSLALTGTAHLAIAAEARDRQETLLSAWVRARLFLRAIAGSLAAIMFLLMLTNLAVNALMMKLLPTGGLTDTVTAVLSGCLVYLISALHVAGVYIVPDFRDLRPDTLA